MILTILAIVTASLLIVVILLQMQGGGLGSSFGGSGEFYRSKRSVEKLLVYATIVLAVLFGVFSILLLSLR